MIRRTATRRRLKDPLEGGQWSCQIIDSAVPSARNQAVGAPSYLWHADGRLLVSCPQDTITINHRFSNDHLIKLSISHALSQSTKLCVFEERVIMIVMNTKDLPGTLAATGVFHFLQGTC